MGGQHPKQDSRPQEPWVPEKRAHRSPSHAQPGPATPGAPGDPSHPKPGPLGPGVQGGHRRHLLGAEAEGSSQNLGSQESVRGWGLGTEPGQLALQAGPSSSHGEGAALDRLEETADTGPTPSPQGPLSQQVNSGTGEKMPDPRSPAKDVPPAPSSEDW